MPPQGNFHLSSSGARISEAIKKLVVTRGPGGSLTYDGHDISYNKGVASNAIDTNGAGDMFAGAFLYALVNGHEYSWAAQFANNASSIVVGAFGPRIKDIEYISLKSKFGF